MSEQVKDTNKEKAIEVFRGIVNNTKSKDIASFISNEIEAGNVDPAYIGVMMKKFAKIQEELWNKTATKEQIYEAVKIYREGTSKTFEVFGSKVQIAEQGYYDFTDTEDPYLEKLKEILTTVTDLIKAREETLKAMALEWESRTNPNNIGMGIPINSSFVVVVHNMPSLLFDEAYAEIHTNPPVKRTKEVIKFFV